MASLTYIRDDSGRVAGITTRVRTDPTAPEPEPDPAHSRHMKTTMTPTANKTPGIHIRWAKGATLRILSYCVISEKGGEQVSHETTAALRKMGHDLQRLIQLEEANGNKIA